MIDPTLTLETGFERLGEDPVLHEDLTITLTKTHEMIDAYLRDHSMKFQQWRMGVILSGIQDAESEIPFDLRNGTDYGLLFDEALTNAINWGTDWQRGQIVQTQVWSSRTGIFSVVSSENPGWRAGLTMENHSALPSTKREQGGGFGGKRYIKSDTSVNLIDDEDWFHVLMCKTLR